MHKGAPNSQSGFTLVELAIVLMIIGLLIGGVLRGQELMNNARVAATIRQITAYTGAVTTFQDAYSQLPGDISTATARLAGCTNTPGGNKCANGNGNGWVGDNIPVIWNTVTIAAQRPETLQFWKHLALAHLITGIDPSADPANPTFGTTNPVGPFAGGFEFYWDSQTTNMRSEHIFRLSNGGVVGSAFNGQAGDGSISPKYAAQIDRKMDDGLPSTGGVYADYGNVLDKCKVNSGPGGSVIYDQTIDQNNCTLFFAY